MSTVTPAAATDFYRKMDIAIVVLGARPRPDGTPSAAMIRRVAKGAATAIAHGGCPVVLSGGPTEGAVSEAQLMARLARADGVEGPRLILEERSRTTFENARETLALEDLRGIGSILLVTDTYHLPRTWLCFRLLAPAGICLRLVGAGWPPAGTALVAVLREAAACLVYAPRLLRILWRRAFTATSTRPEV